MASNKPTNFKEFCESLDLTVSNKKCLEVLVLIDENDEDMRNAVAVEKKRRAFRIKSLEWPANGYFELWRGLNKLHRLCDPKAYFVCNINDEIRFRTSAWDEKLEKYVGFFPDDIFRLCTSVSKYRNYSDFWECGYAPENYPIATKKWIDLQLDWGACHGPDAFQQFVSFYLSRCNWPDKNQYCRDIPVEDISIVGEGAYIGMEEGAMWHRVRKGWKTWHKITSVRMQVEASRRATLLYLNILIVKNKWEDTEIKLESFSLRLKCRNKKTGETYFKKSYLVNAFLIFWLNFIRRPKKYYHCGGNPPPFKYTACGSFLKLLFRA